MTVPIGPFRLVVSISRRCREALVWMNADGASDAELARLADPIALRIDMLRARADGIMFGSRLV